MAMLTEELIRSMLRLVGDNPDRGGLLETPARVAKAWGTWFGGYQVDPVSLLKTFEDGADGVDEMVLETNIPVHSHCEHHMAPFFGVAHVAYIPDGKVVGLSKLVRVVDAFSRRLQVQERLTNQIADCINDALQPKGVGVVVTCEHSCMSSRGVKAQGVKTTTSALRGAMLAKEAARLEFLQLIQMTK